MVYLTTSESFIDAKATQRRSGLHVEAADGILDGVGGKFHAGHESMCGGGVSEDNGVPDEYEGGLYMASNMDDTCMLWDALFKKDKESPTTMAAASTCAPSLAKAPCSRPTNWLG